MSTLLQLIGEKIRMIRKSRGLSQEALGNLAKLSISYISDVERGTRNISLESLEKIIIALDVSPSDIFNFHDISLESGIENKNSILEMIRSILIRRNLEEVKFIHQFTSDFFHLMDNPKS
jgi:transcriptional regulator with XRE-family HTH domain